jgi:hypothetical protein
VRKLRKKYGRAVLGAATAGLQQQFAALADAADRGRNLVPVRHFRLYRKAKIYSIAAAFPVVSAASLLAWETAVSVRALGR